MPTPGGMGGLWGDYIGVVPPGLATAVQGVTAIGGTGGTTPYPSLKFGKHILFRQKKKKKDIIIGGNRKGGIVPPQGVPEFDGTVDPFLAPFRRLDYGLPQTGGTR